MSEWTEEREAEVRARCDGATIGPWLIETYPEDGEPEVQGIYTHTTTGEEIEIVVTDSGVYPPYLGDARFIAAARTDLPDALDEIARLRGLINTYGFGS